MTSQLFFQDLSVKFWYAVITAKVLAAIKDYWLKLKLRVRFPDNSTL